MSLDILDLDYVEQTYAYTYTKSSASIFMLFVNIAVDFFISFEVSSLKNCQNGERDLAFESLEPSGP